MLLEVVSDIPSYRVRHYPAHVQITTWTAADSETFDNTRFHQLVQTYVLACADWGLEKGDTVCTFSSSGQGVLLAMEFALFYSGCIIVPIHMGTPDADVQVILSEVKPRYTITADPKSESRLDVLHDTGVIHIARYPTTSNPDGAPQKAVCEPDDPALIIYTSGSTGTPKGVVLTHRNVMSTVQSLLPIIPIRYRHTVVSYLPVSHIFERIACYCYLVAGVHLHFAEPRNAMALLRKIRPHYFTAVPRILDTAMGRFVRAGDTRHYFVRSVLLWALESGTGQDNSYGG
jgi:long-chain acyl-CoA synthetase